MLRGGSWATIRGAAAPPTASHPPGVRTQHVGFRVCRGSPSNRWPRRRWTLDRCSADPGRRAAPQFIFPWPESPPSFRPTPAPDWRVPWQEHEGASTWRRRPQPVGMRCMSDPAAHRGVELRERDLATLVGLIARTEVAAGMPNLAGLEAAMIRKHQHAQPRGAGGGGAHLVLRSVHGQAQICEAFPDGRLPPPQRGLVVCEERKIIHVAQVGAAAQPRFTKRSKGGGSSWTRTASSDCRWAVRAGGRRRADRRPQTRPCRIRR